MAVKNISRIDSNGTHGWFLRMYRDGETYSKFFSDSRYQSQTAALEAAKDYKRRFNEKYPVEASPLAKGFRDKPQKNNSTGVVGVSETFIRSRGRGQRKIPCFAVSWRPAPNVAKTKKFSIEKYGREEAFRMAVKFRKEKEEEMIQLRTTVNTSTGPNAP
ncbi:MAG: AP2 domain-containing protein [Anaerolineaceae bacterium]|nr:AP2 domain-containing protein [Anaerolineaceae bacterium]MCB9102075.1 AP2 domain-containing protein [Anaerolineales bacterium]